MPAYTPTEFVKDGDYQIALSWADHYQLIWEGYTLISEVPDYPLNERVATLQDVADEAAAREAADLALIEQVKKSSGSLPNFYYAI